MIFTPYHFILSIFGLFIVGFICLFLSKFSKLTLTIAIVSSLVVLIINVLIFPDIVINGITFEYPLVNLPLLEIWFDSLSYFFSILVSLIGFLCILYSYDYMSHEKSVGRYCFWMLAFIGSMILLVSANGILLLILSWELTSLCSYSLISFWNERKKALQGAYKTIIITETGSTILIVGLALLSNITGSVLIHEMISKYAEISNNIFSTLIFISLFIAIITKSVQFPFYIWLPDAMEAPTPVSTLLHAATMVKAGVYLLIRLWPLFMLFVLPWQPVVLIIGLITIFVGVFYMLVQNDLKRFLAYSTISHIGYIVTAVGIGTPFGILVALFHLFNHAITKGLLFLCAGFVEHSVKTRDMTQLGGLATRMRITATTFFIGAISISGIPPLNGFVSKWMIYEAGIKAWVDSRNVLPLLATLVTLIASAVTLAAFIKVIHSVFYGVPKIKFENVEGKNSVIMELPLVFLSILCVIFGIFPYLPLNYLILPAILAIGIQVKEFEFLTISTGVGVISEPIASIMLAFGILLGLLIYVSTFRPREIRVEREKTKIFICGEDPELYSPEQIHISSEHFYITTIKDPLSAMYRYSDLDSMFTSLAKYTDKVLQKLSDKKLVFVGYTILILMIVSALILLLIGG